MSINPLNDISKVYLEQVIESSHLETDMEKREEENEKSDLDILIDFDMKVDLLELIGIEQALSELLGIKVDLITLRSVHASLKPSIESDLIRLV